jgi:hypothetical protein
MTARITAIKKMSSPETMLVMNDAIPSHECFFSSIVTPHFVAASPLIDGNSCYQVCCPG